MGIEGEWDVTIKTPIGTLAVEYVFRESRDGLGGTATYKSETVPLQGIRSEIVADGTVQLPSQAQIERQIRRNLVIILDKE